jgi:hypothetical protein
VVVGGETFISGAADGETWTASAVLPNGQTLNWGAITFYTDYNGQQNCFVSPSWVICGGTSLTFSGTRKLMPPSGLDDALLQQRRAIPRGDFLVLPQIRPEGAAGQPAAHDHYDNQCRRRPPEPVRQLLHGHGPAPLRSWAAG